MPLEEDHLASPCYESPNCASAHLTHHQAPRAQIMLTVPPAPDAMSRIGEGR